MNDVTLQKKTLSVLERLDGIAIRESVLASEVEILVGHPLTADEFRAAMKELLGTRRVKRGWDPFGEALYEITGAGRDALMGREGAR